MDDECYLEVLDNLGLVEGLHADELHTLLLLVKGQVVKLELREKAVRMEVFSEDKSL